MQTLRGTPAQKGDINASQTDMKTHEKPPLSATKALRGRFTEEKLQVLVRGGWTLKAVILTKESWLHWKICI